MVLIGWEDMPWAYGSGKALMKAPGTFAQVARNRHTIILTNSQYRQESASFVTNAPLSELKVRAPRKYEISLCPANVQSANA
jgi:hypothetical protein